MDVNIVDEGTKGIMVRNKLGDDEDVAEEVSGDDVEDEEFREIDFEQSEEDDNKFERFVIIEDLDEDQHKELREELTDEYDTYDLRNVYGEDNDEVPEVRGKTRRRAPKFKQYNRDYDLREPKFTLGFEFSTMKECKKAMRYYATRCARLLRFLKNEPHRLRVKCEGESEDDACPLMFYASHIGGGPTVRVKTLVPNHTCGRVETSRFATSSWQAARFEEDLRTNPNMTDTDFMTILVRKNYNVDVTKDHVYKCKQMSAEKIQGTIEEQYAKLWDYSKEFKRQNLGSTILIKTRLRGPHPSQLLSATEIDAHNGMFPIAYGVVKIENTET
ncbi:unnamed protein product [Prunus armeniaca]